MNELRRMAYLDALGIDSYVSRAQLPGAAVTRRMAIISRPRNTVPVDTEDTAGVQCVVARTTALLGGQREDSAAPARTERAPVSSPRPVQHTVPRFSLTIIVAGDWLWLEDLSGMPLTTEQVQLVQSMAHALRVNLATRESGNFPAESDSARTNAARPDVMQFDWPIHSNHQLDQGEEAAQAGVAGFLERKLEQHGCRGLVVLGQRSAARVPVQKMHVVTVCTAGSAEILARPALKQQVWRDLLPLTGQR